jgi:hypothetical protein
MGSRQASLIADRCLFQRFSDFSVQPQRSAVSQGRHKVCTFVEGRQFPAIFDEYSPATLSRPDLHSEIDDATSHLDT